MAAKQVSDMKKGIIRLYKLNLVKMKKNVGSIDKVIRIIIAIIAIILIATCTVSGTLAIITGVIGGAMLLTAIFGYCGLYSLIGFSSCPSKK